MKTTSGGEIISSRGRLILKTILILLLVLFLILAIYVAYVLVAWHRIGDMDLDVKGSAGREVLADHEYKMVSWNIGFGAYEADYSFFMDGGTQSRAWSKERLQKNMSAIAGILSQENADFYLLQEVDIGSTRTYHVDEREALEQALPGTDYQSVFAQNYDSPYLFYPILAPHGASRSGIMTFSSCSIASALRKELPIETSLMRLLDLDRCYSVSRLPAGSGTELVLYNLHLSAYTSDGTIATAQLELLLQDMQAEYEKGNYCIAGGDFNKDLLGDSSSWFGTSDKEYNWAQPIPESLFDGLNVSLVAPLDEEDPVPSCRNADSAYHEGQYVLTVDGFLVSDNVEVKESSVIDTAFACSDHNPTEMSFVLAG